MLRRVDNIHLTYQDLVYPWYFEDVTNNKINFLTATKNSKCTNLVKSVEHILTAVEAGNRLEFFSQMFKDKDKIVCFPGVSLDLESKTKDAVDENIDLLISNFDEGFKLALKAYCNDDNPSTFDNMIHYGSYLYGLTSFCDERARLFDRFLIHLSNFENPRVVKTILSRHFQIISQLGIIQDAEPLGGIDLKRYSSRLNQNLFDIYNSVEYGYFSAAGLSICNLLTGNQVQSKRHLDYLNQFSIDNSSLNGIYAILFNDKKPLQ